MKAMLAWMFLLLSFAGFTDAAPATTNATRKVYVLPVRNDIMLVRHFQYLGHHENERGASVIERGVRERFAPIVATAISLGLLFLPFVVLGNTAGLEIVHPMAVTILGGIVTSTIVTLGVIPALYLRFGAGAAAAGSLDFKPAAA